MASLSELYQAVQMQQQAENQSSSSGRVASFLNKALQGARSGREMGLRDRDAMVDRQSKIMDIKKKQADLEQEAINRRISNNMAKRMGLLDLDLPEADAARPAALNAITDSKPEKDNSTAGRLSSIYAGDTEFKVVPHFSTQSGFTFDFKDAKDKEKKDPGIRMKRISDMAEESARREKFNLYTQMYGPEVAQAKFANIQATPDEVEKFIPEATAFLEGQPEKARSLRGDRRKQSLIKKLDEFYPQVETLKKESDKFLPTSGRSTARADLERIGEFFKSKDYDEIDSDLSKEILRLKKDPAKNRIQLREISERLAKLRSIRGGK